MKMSRLISVAALAMLAPLGASAGYFTWDAVTLPTSTGASCGNGTPYRFFINRNPFTTKTVVIFEGGGACWEQDACRGKGGTLGLVFTAFGWYIFYLMSGALENYWGAFRFNLFLLLSFVLTVALSFLAPLHGVTNLFILGSVFLAFAYLNPDFELLLFFILPVKIKWRDAKGAMHENALTLASGYHTVVLAGDSK